MKLDELGRLQGVLRAIAGAQRPDRQAAHASKAKLTATADLPRRPVAGVKHAVIGGMRRPGQDPAQPLAAGQAGVLPCAGVVLGRFLSHLGAAERWMREPARTFEPHHGAPSIATRQ